MGVGPGSGVGAGFIAVGEMFEAGGISTAFPRFWGEAGLGEETKVAGACKIGIDAGPGI